MLVERGAQLGISEERFGTTPLGWALHGWCYPPPERTGADYYRAVSLLIKAGSDLDFARNLDRAQVKKLRGDSQMLRILGRSPKRSKETR